MRGPFRSPGSPPSKRECDEEQDYPKRASADALQVEIPVTLAGAVQHSVELQAGEAEVGRDALLVFLGDVKAEEDVAVALGAQLPDHLAHEPRILPGQQLGERTGAPRRDIFNFGHGVAVGLGLAPLDLAVVLDSDA